MSDAPIVGNGGVQSGWGSPEDVMSGANIPTNMAPMPGSEFTVPQPKPDYMQREQSKEERLSSDSNSEYALYYRVLNAMVGNGIDAAKAMEIAEDTVWPKELDDDE